MDSSLKVHKLNKARKSNTILKHRQLRKIANLLRYAEMCVVLILISRLSFQLPVAVKNSSEYLRGFSGFIVSPCFVFLVGNVIIITLFAQSGQFSNHHASGKENLEHDLYQEFLQNSTNIGNHIIQEKQSKKTEDDIKQIQKIDGDRVTVKYPEKLIKTEKNIKVRRIDRCLIKSPEKQSMKAITKTEDGIKDQRIDGGTIKVAEKESTEASNIGSEVKKDYRRCQTEMIVRHVQSEMPRVLQRCETEKNNNRGRSIEAEKMGGGITYPEDGMSNDEFRRTIEAFIARQQRLRRQEKCCTA